MSAAGRLVLTLGVGAVLAFPAGAEAVGRRAAVSVARPAAVAGPAAVARPAAVAGPAAVARPAAVVPQASQLEVAGPVSDLNLPGGGGVLHAGQQLLDGNLGGAAGSLAGGAANAVASGASTALFVAIGAAVSDAAHGVLNDTATALSATTSPQLRSTWFSSTYWRMAAVAAVLTLPFLFAAAVQALIRSDLSLLIRSAFGYLPLAMLAIAIAAPLTTLLLASCDELTSFISSAAGNASAHFLARAGLNTAILSGLDGSPFLAFLIGLFLIAAAFALWIELLLREAAVYVIVLMLPLAFAAFVWPARRVWAIRAVELLVALILAKFAIVAVLSLGGAAVSAAGHDVTTLMAGGVLIMLAAFSPWALLRLVPLAELATGVAELRSGLRAADVRSGIQEVRALDSATRVASAAAEMRRLADLQGSGPPPNGSGSPANGSAPPPDASAPPADGSAPPPGDSAPPAGATQPADEDSSPSTGPETWQRQPVLELDAEHLRSTPVQPQEDAE
jgi:hypothetical protein